jgi:hypothetical protein
MNNSLTAYPLCWPAGWPRTESYARTRAKFFREVSTRGTSGNVWKDRKSITVSEGIQRVLAELKSMGILSDDLLISSNLKLRLDGLPRGDQSEPDDVGVCVYWQEINAPRCMAIDIYDTTAGNLAAIAATLSALRAIERHGGAQILNRAFSGFVALPGPGTRTCWEILGMGEGELLGEGNADRRREVIQAAYRMRARRVHPDVGGSDDLMAELVSAREEALRKAGC